jgi:deoxyribose-phosphate aldolase
MAHFISDGEESGSMKDKTMITVNDIAKMIDHSILHPIFTDDDLKNNCEIAKEYHVATVCVKPYHTRMAADMLRGSDVAVCTVIGFPHGNSTIDIKAAETLQVIKDGAVEIDMVINIGKVLQADWNYIEKELKTIHGICLNNKALLKVIFETDYVSRDEEKIKLCELCSTNIIDFVKTSTGYGFVKGNDGRYSYTGATEHDIILMRKYCAPCVQIKAAGGIRTLEQILRMRELGVTRVGATATVTILEEAKKRFQFSSY